MRGEDSILQRAEKSYIGKALFELRLLRPGANDDFGAGQVKREESFEVLFDGDPADRHEDRAREAWIDGAARVEQIDVDPAGPHAQIGKPALTKLGPQRGRGHHGHRRSGVEPTQDGVDRRLRNRQSGRNVFRKARRIAGRERQSVAAAIGAYGKADRSFGGDMDGVGSCGVDALGNFPSGSATPNANPDRSAPERLENLPATGNRSSRQACSRLSPASPRCGPPR